MRIISESPSSHSEQATRYIKLDTEDENIVRQQESLILHWAFWEDNFISGSKMANVIMKFMGVVQTLLPTSTVDNTCNHKWNRQSAYNGEK